MPPARDLDLACYAVREPAAFELAVPGPVATRKDAGRRAEVLSVAEREQVDGPVVHLQDRVFEQDFAPLCRKAFSKTCSEPFYS